MSDTVIRKATVGDLDAILTLWIEFMDFHRQRDPHFSRTADAHERFREWLSGHVAAERSCVPVAERDGRIVGYCLATIVAYPPIFLLKEYGTVYDLAVTARCRRQGIGERLYRVVHEWFVAQGVHRIELLVAVANDVSRPFWRKMGFAPYTETLFREI